MGASFSARPQWVGILISTCRLVGALMETRVESDGRHSRIPGPASLLGLVLTHHALARGSNLVAEPAAVGRPTSLAYFLVWTALVRGHPQLSKVRVTALGSRSACCHPGSCMHGQDIFSSRMAQLRPPPPREIESSFTRSFTGADIRHLLSLA